jgi:hypothetical protein
MPTVVEQLIETATADTDLLSQNQQLGDVVSIPREVTFLLIARSAKQAQLVASFINDYRYGHATAERKDVHVRITMPVTQPVLCSVSGFFACLSEIYELKYDGWESEIQRRA